MRMSGHATRQAESLGVHPKAVLLAAREPSVTYTNRRHPHQRRHVRGDICAVVDLPEMKVVTFYLDGDKQYT